MLRISFLIGSILWLLTACVTVQDGPTNSEKASKINVQLGIGYYQQGNLELANEKLLKALDQDPNSSQAHYAYAVLQHRFLDKEKTEFHFRKAIELNPKNSEALTNFGAYLCNDNRMQEAEKMFLQAIQNPLYKTPELAYTNAAICLLKADSSQKEKAKIYLTKALAIRNNFDPALINLAELNFDEKNHELARLYLERYHLVTKPTARSLWLGIRNALELDNQSDISKLVERLRTDFPDSKEYQSWLALDK